MDTAAFESALLHDGFGDVGRKSLAPNHATQPHAHDFDIRALVLDGEITLTAGDEVTRHAVGQVFNMPHGREHRENVGPAGVTTLSGIRRPAVP